MVRSWEVLNVNTSITGAERGVKRNAGHRNINHVLRTLLQLNLFSSFTTRNTVRHFIINNLSRFLCIHGCKMGTENTMAETTPDLQPQQAKQNLYPTLCDIRPSLTQIAPL